MMNANETVKTMMAQISYRQTFMMMGTTKWAYSNEENWIKFNIGSGGKVNSIKIIYDYNSDTYIVQGYTKGIIKSEYEQVYCDQLLDIIETITGMYATLHARQ